MVRACKNGRFLNYLSKSVFSQKNLYFTIFIDSFPANPEIVFGFGYDKGVYQMTFLYALFSQRVLATLFVRYYGFMKIPLLYFVRPSVLELNNEKVVIKIPLRRRTRNHLKSMYFGALAIGADAAGGLIAMKLIRESGQQVSLIFKYLNADFLKRAEGDVYFTCTRGREIAGLVKSALDSEERVEMPIEVIATIPDLLGDEPVAKFTLGLSLKKKTEEKAAT
jgi:acyl-coenzyme A thioesterase PaaI-like protein